MDLATIVITCYNQAQYLSEAIEGALVQTYPDLEILVVDDGSTDDTGQAGFRRACASVSGAVDAGTDCYELPRVQVQDWDGDTFKARLLASARSPGDA
jgi:GT2 family glycosyltransferase